MDCKEATSVPAGGGSTFAGHYNSAVHLFTPSPELISGLLDEAGSGSSDSVLEAIPLAHDAAKRINALLDAVASPCRVGPTIGIHQETVKRNKCFMLDNFFGLLPAQRHTNPNKVLINIGSDPVAIEVAAADVSTFVTAAATIGASSVDIGSANVDTYVLSPGQALILVGAVQPYRYLSEGNVLMLHGFFAA